MLLSKLLIGVVTSKHCHIPAVQDMCISVILSVINYIMYKTNRVATIMYCNKYTKVNTSYFL